MLRSPLSAPYTVGVSELKRGQVIILRDKLYVIQLLTHQTYGRGNSTYKLDLKELRTSAKASERFPTMATVEVAELESKTLQFMYADAEGLHLLDPETYEETIAVPHLLQGGHNVAPFLVGDMELQVQTKDGIPVMIKHADRVNAVVASTAEPSGASGSERSVLYKEATLESGAMIQVPDFIATGEKVIVDLSSKKYVSRVKS
ncbi:hypothetical protein CAUPRSCDRAFT_8603 [Caulochytrium protostelioides]|uniref:Translation elongation factor P n=1 Tax=Caulochytrium protostelioides TaxID=1555241 RepID=A0A4P9WSA4_9FUNG|nr:hypothetical protein CAUPRSCDRAFT_8603 [Caulochytrium protostelioides]